MSISCIKSALTREPVYLFAPARHASQIYVIYMASHHQLGVNFNFFRDVKVIILGSAAVGKTCLLQRYLTGDFKDDTISVGSAVSYCTLQSVLCHAWSLPLLHYRVLVHLWH